VLAFRANRRVRVGTLIAQRYGMAHFTPLPALIGGSLIGLGASLLLVTTGRGAGVSGIVDGALQRGAASWRWSFLGGLVVGGVTIRLLAPSLIPGLAGNALTLIVAGLVVGFGARIAGGCTSGHGIVGTSRLSPRSLLATTLFMVAGGAMVALMRGLRG
jgi:uncharacterized protein